jgi:hypothetical protein
LRRFAVEYFRNPGGAVEQFLRCFGVELRIVTEELHECRKLALEPGLVHRVDHLLM